MFVEIMKKLFEEDERVKISNVLIIKTTNDEDEVIYSQIRFFSN